MLCHLLLKLGHRARGLNCPPGLLELEELLGDYLETRVKITVGGKQGRITVDFADLADLERLYRVVTGDRQRRAETG